MATSRWLAAPAVIAVVWFAVWVTTPDGVIETTATDWEKCKLAYPTDAVAVRAIAPDVRPTREAAPILTARLTAPGLDFDAAQLRACLRLGAADPRKIDVAIVETPETGVAVVTFSLPKEPFPWLDWRRGRAASLAVVTADGGYAWTGEFVYASRFWAFVLATAIATLLFVGLVYLRKAGTAWKTWLMGVFLGEDQQPSLSAFQILLWTIVTVWSLLYVFFSTGDLLAITEQVMVLLGFAGAGSLAARWVAASREPLPTRATGDAEQRPPQFWAILENRGQLDLFKLQLFLFTVLIAAYVVFRVVRQSAFPEIDPQLLMLMGVSNSLYVGSKFAQPSATEKARALEVQRDGLRLRVVDLEAEIERLQAQSQELGSKMEAESEATTKQALTDQKTLCDKKLADVRAELAQARTDLQAKEKEYRDALGAALATS